MKIIHFFILSAFLFIQPAMAFRITYVGPAKSAPKPVVTNPEAVASDAQSDTKEAPQDPNLLFSNKEEPTGEVIKGKCTNGEPFLIYRNTNNWQSEKPIVATSDPSIAPADFARNIVCAERQ
jgi:hypothetical protein